MTLLQDVRQETQFVAMEIRVRGRVQGVGFRPTVWRIARELDLTGEVLNDCEGVLVRVGGSPSAVGDFIARLESEPPPLARIDKIEVRAFDGALPSEFRIAEKFCGRRTHGGRAGRGDLSGLRSGNRRSVPAPLPLSVRQLHALRAAPQHRQGHPLRPRQYDDVAVCDVRGVRGGISQFRRPAFPRRSDRVPCLRSHGEAGPSRRPSDEFRPTFDARRCRCGPRTHHDGRNRRNQGSRRLSSRLRRNQRGSRRAPAPAEAPRREAVRADGEGSRRHQAVLHRGCR